uniref:Uncharacterized protein n=1 Tax=viral metagenome TaxID=1070528 RepID=A0A6C0C8H2_9ZZZZ
MEQLIKKHVEYAFNNAGIKYHNKKRLTYLAENIVFTFTEEGLVKANSRTLSFYEFLHSLRGDRIVEKEEALYNAEMIKYLDSRKIEYFEEAGMFILYDMKIELDKYGNWDVNGEEVSHFEIFEYLGKK